jgi:hypothetical protein
MTAAQEAIEGFLMSVLRETWDVFQKQALVFVLAAALVMLLSLVSLGLLLGPLTVGFLDMARRARAGELLQVGDVFGRFDSLFSSLIATT